MYGMERLRIRYVGFCGSNLTSRAQATVVAKHKVRYTRVTGGSCSTRKLFMQWFSQFQSCCPHHELPCFHGVKDYLLVPLVHHRTPRASSEVHQAISLCVSTQGWVLDTADSQQIYLICKSIIFLTVQVLNARLLLVAHFLPTGS